MSESIIWRDVEAFAVCCMCVAGKNGARTERAVEALLERRGCDGVFEWIRLTAEGGLLESELRRAGIGQYRKLVRGLSELASSGLDLRACTLDARERNAYVAPGWTPALLQKVCRYYARDIFRQIPFEEFQPEEPHHRRSRQEVLFA